MYFQIEKIILWPKKIQYSYKTIDFCCDKINVITGASRTGKSAIIPIIDYCLGESKCQIPVNTIRDACSWFGIIIKLDGKKILLARKEPGQRQSTDEMLLMEGRKLNIPKIPNKNTSRQKVCRYLDELARITFLEMDKDEFNGFKSRPSFRDMIAFCYQPQNIVANANTLFYKADTMEHRIKLINIFPYVLGAVTPEILAKRQELNELQRKLKQKERELQKIQEMSEKWRIEINTWISMAKEIGLINIKYDIGTIDFSGQMNILEKILQKSSEDTNILEENIKMSAEKIISLQQQENQVSMELTKYKSRYLQMTQFMESIDEYRNTLTIQIDRLSISKWLNDLVTQNEICPFCGGKHNVKNQMGELINNLETLEVESEEIAQIPAAFEREYILVQEKISELTEKLGAIQKSIKIQNDEGSKTNNQKYTLENVARFLGKVQYAEETYRAIGYDGELQGDIIWMKNRIEMLKTEINENVINKRFKAAKKNIELKVMKLLPLLDTERPEDSVEIEEKDLTISVMSELGRKDYLWEIGSGSNWLSYHISVSLAFQLFFAEQNYSPIPQFVVYDQPSQVYFPNKIAQKEDDKEEDPQLEDDDIKAVKKIFKTMSTAMEKTNHQMQIIVLEHANELAWEGINNVHLVEEWRGENNKLIPNEWIV